MRKSPVLALLIVASLGFSCKKNEPAPEPTPLPPVTEAAPTLAPEPVAVGGVTLGTEVGADKKVTAPRDVFGVNDKVYASIDTTGQGHFKLRALWSYLKDGKTATVNENTMEFDTVGPATNEFHIENSKAWPTGTYQVEIFLGDDTTPVATRSFTIQ